MRLVQADRLERHLIACPPFDRMPNWRAALCGLVVLGFADDRRAAPAQAVTREASCSCGQLRALADGEPVEVTICHCLACQRRTGSAFAVQGLYRRAQVQTSGRFKEFVRTTERGDERRYCFCPDCGATVFFTAPSAPEVVGVPAGAFADPSFPPPRVSVYESRRHSWVVAPASVERTFC